MAGLHLAKRYLVASDSEPHAPDSRYATRAG